MSGSFGDRLHGAVEKAGTCACVGMDPRPANFPPALRPDPDAPPSAVSDAIREWGNTILESIAGSVPAIKLQSACYEAWGPDGMAAFADLCSAARSMGIVVLADCKRGDISASARHYAEAFLSEGSPFPCDAMTVNPYLGGDAIAPLLEARRANAELSSADLERSLLAVLDHALFQARETLDDKAAEKIVADVASLRVFS